MGERIANLIFVIGVIGFTWLQYDTWKQARETNQFMGQLLEVASKPRGETRP